MPSPNPTLRHPGGQPGNTNAIKHGFYSPRLHQDQDGTLEDASFNDIRNEIALLRGSIRRAVEWSANIQSLPDALSFLRILALASASLSRLVRTQQAIASSNIDQTLDKTISEIGKVLENSYSNDMSNLSDQNEESGDTPPGEWSSPSDQSEEFGDTASDVELYAPQLPEFNPSQYGVEEHTSELQSPTNL